jgi:putative nucleotidyltransferase with HDIG domain
LGATQVLIGPAYQKKLLWALAEHVGAGRGVPPPAEPSDENDAASVGATAIASMFAAVARGTPIDVKGTNDAGSKIADRVAEKGLSDWLATVRRHHEGTYQHCLLVTGVAVDFGLSLGLARQDVERLYSAAMFHDIGKATIPLAILDKPARLDMQERTLIETHPVLGYDALKDNKSISPEVLDAVRHHHEYLDGSGYPDALCADSISDVVRILTISDIFSALIEDRRYREPMPREDAYDILCRMQGKLEKPLVATFRQVALHR